MRVNYIRKYLCLPIFALERLEKQLFKICQVLLQFKIVQTKNVEQKENNNICARLSPSIT